MQTPIKRKEGVNENKVNTLLVFYFPVILLEPEGYCRQSFATFFTTFTIKCCKSIKLTDL